MTDRISIPALREWAEAQGVTVLPPSNILALVEAVEAAQRSRRLRKTRVRVDEGLTDAQEVTDALAERVEADHALDAALARFEWGDENE